MLLKVTYDFLLSWSLIQAQVDTLALPSAGWEGTAGDQDPTTSRSSPPAGAGNAGKRPASQSEGREFPWAHFIQTLSHSLRSAWGRDPHVTPT